MIPTEIIKAYEDFVYEATKALLTPVVGALTEVITEAVAAGVREGVANAVRPEGLWSLLNKKK